jgi:hypothetical protein
VEISINTIAMLQVMTWSHSPPQRLCVLFWFCLKFAGGSASPLSSLFIPYNFPLACLARDYPACKLRTKPKQNTKPLRRRVTWSLVFVLMLISIFIGQNKELFFMHVLKKDVLLLCT